ncbi:hypothetical protein FHE66_06215 [Georgenia sp. 311]|uniref:Uncharacterized protein n=1 Tax=Georgenia wutianyii TaxID=2585135 RepID=A0ABX5VMM9_9MICO|nr:MULTISPECIES: hypothetical protein [Georgenia]QDB79767.1 hypothetical protein FE251_10560 [Georgenia wutianyii]TNC18516.1 hypothetical protein FHE66_06215 [Georgenia sp. 311]
MNDSTQAASAAPRPAPPRPGPDAPPAPVPELAELDTLADRPLTEQLAVLDTVHRALAAQLSSAES